MAVNTAAASSMLLFAVQDYFDLCPTSWSVSQ